jgi:hypothetical protein
LCRVIVPEIRQNEKFLRDLESRTYLYIYDVHEETWGSSIPVTGNPRPAVTEGRFSAAGSVEHGATP